MYTERRAIEAQNLLPGDLPCTVTDASFMEWIASASNDVDDGVGERYPMLSTGRRFAAWPETPYTIQQCAAWLAASYGLVALGRVSRSKDVPSNHELYRGWATDRLERIREGEVQVYSQTGASLGAGRSGPICVSKPDNYIDGADLEWF